MARRTATPQEAARAARAPRCRAGGNLRARPTAARASPREPRLRRPAMAESPRSLLRPGGRGRLRRGRGREVRRSHGRASPPASTSGTTSRPATGRLSAGWSRRRAGARHIQMGYMLRYSTAFRQISAWQRAGLLGDLAVRGHMSTSSAPATGARGLPWGLPSSSPHIIDQAVWLFGARPARVTFFWRNDATPAVPRHADNTLVVLSSSAAQGAGGLRRLTSPTWRLRAARRFEVYGTRGSAIVLEPFEPGRRSAFAWTRHEKAMPARAGGRGRANASHDLLPT